MAARIAYFIMVHHKPAQFDWLMRAIDHPDDLFFVHVDMKSRLGIKADRRGVWREVRRICADRPNVRLLRSRFTNWGGWSLSRILLDTIALALRTDPDWTHFVNLSGQCYPLRSLDEVKDGLAASGDRVHVEMRPVSELPADDWHHRAHPLLETPLRAFILPGRKPPPRDFTLNHKGSQWTILPRGFCEWAMESPVTRQVSAYLRGLLLSDELIVQALVENGPYRDRIAGHFGREIIWPGPRVLTMADLPRLRASPAWFARKFDLARDAGVLAVLAKANGFTPGPILPSGGEG